MLLHSETAEAIVPAGANPDHFGGTMWPMDDIGIASNGVLHYNVADIPSPDFAAVRDWETGERKMIQYEYDLTN